MKENLKFTMTWPEEIQDVSRVSMTWDQYNEHNSIDGLFLNTSYIGYLINGSLSEVSERAFFDYSLFQQTNSLLLWIELNKVSDLLYEFLWSIGHVNLIF